MTTLLVFIVFIVTLAVHKSKKTPKRRSRRKKEPKFKWVYEIGSLKGKRIGDRLRKPNGQFV